MSSPQDPSHQKWVQEQLSQLRDRLHDREQEAWYKANEAATASGNLALKTAVLINGAAAITLLTFLGGIVEKARLSPNTKLDALTLPLLWFVWGAAFATLAMGFGYLVNFSHAGILSNRKRLYVEPFVQETAESKRWRTVGLFFTVLAIIAAIVSFVFFICGMYSVRAALSTLVLNPAQ